MQDAKDKAELRFAQLQETRCHKSTSTKLTKCSSRSSLSDNLIEACASLEAKKVRSSFARKEAEIAAHQAMAESQIKILLIRQSPAAI